MNIHELRVRAAERRPRVQCLCVYWHYIVHVLTVSEDQNKHKSDKELVKFLPVKEACIQYTLGSGGAEL